MTTETKFAFQRTWIFLTQSLTLHASQASVDVGNRVLEGEGVMGFIMAMAATDNREIQVI